MDKIRLEILGLSSSQAEVGHYALVLGEVNGHRRLPIIIDGFQARAIAFEIENIRPNRPMTHDLLVSICRAAGMELLEVIVTHLQEGIFFAKLIFEHEGEIVEIDSRTSDAVAIAVRFKVGIYTFEEVLSEAGIEVIEEKEDDLFDEDELDEELEGLEDFDEEEEDEAEETMSDKIKKLNKKMNDAIAAEDYEEAARLRDEISQLDSSSEN